MEGGNKVGEGKDWMRVWDELEDTMRLDRKISSLKREVF